MKNTETQINIEKADEELIYDETLIGEFSDKDITDTENVGITEFTLYPLSTPV